MKSASLILASVMVLPWSVYAHAIMIDSTPPVNGTITSGHETVRIRFNSRIDRERSRVTLIAPDKTQTRIVVGSDGPPDVMMTQADLQPGNYTIRWQVLAIDGHITRGDLPFTVAAP